jgi:hypothetical protein
VPDDSILESIWPWIEKANAEAESFSQISRAMTVIVPEDRHYVQTDKESVIRAQTYKLFANEIERAYQRSTVTSEPKSRYDLQEMQEYLLRGCQNELHIPLADISSDLFSSGLDSLKATQFASRIRLQIELDEKSKNFRVRHLYLACNIENLARYLYDPQKFDIGVSEESSLNETESLIARFGEFKVKERKSVAISGSHNVLVS